MIQSKYSFRSAIMMAMLVLSASAMAADVKPVSATEFRDAKFISCMATASEASVLKDGDKVVAKCLGKAEKATAKWQESKAKREAKAVERAALNSEKDKAKAIAKCHTDTECQAADGKEI